VLIISTLLTWTANEPMQEVNWNGSVYNMPRGSKGLYEEEWDDDCGILLGCDKGDDDSQIDW